MKKEMLMTTLIVLNLACLTMFMMSSTSFNTNEVVIPPTAEEKMYSPNGYEPYIGEITMFAGNFPPRGWAFCNGQVLSISPNAPLFSLLGTTYGGDGRTNFALPDLRGRAPIHAGQGPGLIDRRLGSSGFLVEKPAPKEGEPEALNAVPYTAINYIIALEGNYPPRN